MDYDCGLREPLHAHEVELATRAGAAKGWRGRARARRVQRRESEAEACTKVAYQVVPQNAQNCEHHQALLLGMDTRELVG